MDNLHKDLREHTTLPGAETAGLSPEEIRALIQENENLRQELRIRDNDILSHDQVFDSIVSGTLHVILVMSVATYQAEFITSNLENALGVQTGEAMEDVRRISPAFEDIEKYDRREETFIHRTNGSRRQYLIYVIHLPYGRSDRVAVVLLCTSNAAKGDLEEMMLQQTQDVNRAAGYFLASMSHDFRVPISSISGFVMLLMKNAENPSKVREYAHRIGISCQEIMGTVDQILDMSRIGSGDLSMESEEFGLGLMLEEVSTIFSSLANARNQKFVFSSKGIEHDIVLGDKSRIMEMLRGVLSNAVKFTPPGGRVELTVTGTPDREGREVSLTFEVRDTGIGMDKASVDSYFQGEFPEDARIEPGRGTGIWLTRKLVSLMGGTISVQSIPGEGTIIWIRLRLKMVNGSDHDFWNQRGIRRMLVVNSNLQEGARIRNLMQSAGVDTLNISSGYATVKMIEQSSAEEMGFDLILLDEDIEDMDWREVLGNLRAMSWIRMPEIFLMSGRSAMDREIEGTSASHVLQKPFYFSALHKLVERAFEKQTDGGRVNAQDEDYSLEGLRFLAAEDNAMNADLLKELLETSGARCEVARNGRAALAMFSNSRPGYYDAILMDIQMPVMDGCAAASAIRSLDREDARTIQIYAMTAGTLEEDVARSFEAGMNAHIPKPVDIHVIKSHIRRKNDSGS